MYCYVINSTFIIYQIIYNSNKNSEMVGFFIYLFDIMATILHIIHSIYTMANLYTDKSYCNL